MQLQRKRGFTLIELLVVVLIIGILAAIAVPQYQKAVVRTRYTQVILLVESLYRAEQLYHDVNRKYTVDLNLLPWRLPNWTSVNAKGTTTDGAVHGVNWKWGACWLDTKHNIDSSYEPSHIACSISVSKKKLWYVRYLRNGKRACATETADGGRLDSYCTQFTGNTASQATGNWTPFYYD